MTYLWYLIGIVAYLIIAAFVYGVARARSTHPDPLTYSCWPLWAALWLVLRGGYYAWLVITTAFDYIAGLGERYERRRV